MPCNRMPPRFEDVRRMQTRVHHMRGIQRVFRVHTCLAKRQGRSIPRCSCVRGRVSNRAPRTGIVCDRVASQPAILVRFIATTPFVPRSIFCGHCCGPRASTVACKHTRQRERERESGVLGFAMKYGSLNEPPTNSRCVCVCACLQQGEVVGHRKQPCDGSVSFSRSGRRTSIGRSSSMNREYGYARTNPISPAALMGRRQLFSGKSGV